MGRFYGKFDFIKNNCYNVFNIIKKEKIFLIMLTTKNNLYII